MQQGSVKARRVEIHRLRPGAVDLRGGDQIVVDVKKAGVHGAHDAIDQIKQPVLLAPAQAGRPHALGGGKAPQRKPLRVPQQMGLQLPVLQIPGMIHRDPGEPLKGGAGQIVVVSPAAEAGVGVKARQDGISDHNDIPRFMDNMILHVIPFPEICPPSIFGLYEKSREQSPMALLPRRISSSSTCEPLVTRGAASLYQATTGRPYDLPDSQPQQWHPTVQRQ